MSRSGSRCPCALTGGIHVTNIVIANMASFLFEEDLVEPHNTPVAVKVEREENHCDGAGRESASA